jgi:endonuclease YncB( thermonuclease family)
MVEVDTTDLSYPTSQINEDILSIDSKVDALAREWLARIQVNLWQFDASVRTRITWFQDQKRNPLNIYEGLLPHHNAILADLNLFKKFLDENGYPKTSSYYQFYDAYALYYSGYSDIVKPPALVQADLDAGMLVGICESVDDGDTLFINGKEVRLTGIDTMEKGTYRGGGLATERLRELVVGKLITVFFDPHQPVDMYLRCLGAVYLGDGSKEKLFLRPDWKKIFVNYIMVDECLAEPNDKGRNMYIDPTEIKAAGEKCKVASTPSMARLTLKSSPTHARIFIDGQPIQKVTPDWVDLVPGIHHITLAADGCSAYHEDVDVTYGVNVFFRTLLKLPIAVGLLNIFTTPEDCEVIIADMPQGLAPLIGVQLLASAPAVITVVKEGYQSKTISVLPLAGRYIDLIFDPLERKT